MSAPRRLVRETRFSWRSSPIFAVFALSFGPPSAARAAQSLPPECGTRAELEHELRSRLPADVSLEALSTLEVTIEPAPPHYLLRVRSNGEERSLADADCRELFRAAVVISAAMLEPSREVAVAAAEPPAGASPSLVGPPKAVAKVALPAPAPVPLRSLPDEREPAPRLRLEPRLTLGMGFASGLLPKPAFALELEGALFDGRFAAAFGARYLAPTSERKADGRGVRISAVGAELLGVWRLHPALEVRAGLLGHRLFGEGLGSAEAQRGSAWSLGPMAGLSALLLRRTSFVMLLGVEATGELVRARFQILDYGEVFRVPGWNGSCFVRAGLTFDERQ